MSAGFFKSRPEYRQSVMDRYPHGARTRYVAGCRCEACVAANRAYRAKQRAAYARGERDVTVSTDRALAHLCALSAQGVGRKAVSEASGIALCVIEDIKSGRKTRIRTSTQRRILAVTEGARMDGAHLPADQTKALIAELREEGFTARELARRLGYRTRHLDIGRFITYRNADRIKRLHTALTSEALIPASFGKPRRRHNDQEKRA